MDMAQKKDTKRDGASEMTPQDGLQQMEGIESESCSASSEAERKIAELTETLQRLQAEFDNYQKRVDREMDAFRKFASQGLIEDLLPVMDSFGLALLHTNDNPDVAKGVELVFSQFQDVLARRGVKKLDEKGIFDPNVHEALLTEVCNKPEGTILEVLQSGYTLNGKLIRAAKVKIAKN